jgi:hypothetical protein
VIPRRARFAPPFRVATLVESQSRLRHRKINSHDAPRSARRHASDSQRSGRNLTSSTEQEVPRITAAATPPCSVLASSVRASRARLCRHPILPIPHNRFGHHVSQNFSLHPETGNPQRLRRRGQRRLRLRCFYFSAIQRNHSQHFDFAVLRPALLDHGAQRRFRRPEPLKASRIRMISRD